MDLSFLRIPFLFRRRQGPPRLIVLEPAARWATRDQILLLPLSGVIDKGSAEPSALLAGPGMLTGLKDKLQAAAANPRIKAVMLRVDSPGGSVTAANLIHREIIDSRRRSVGLTSARFRSSLMLVDLAASGGLYIAMAADEIYAPAHHDHRLDRGDHDAARPHRARRKDRRRNARDQVGRSIRTPGSPSARARRPNSAKSSPADR